MDFSKLVLTMFVDDDQATDGRALRIAVEQTLHHFCGPWHGSPIN